MQTILIIDDEAPVRSAIRMILKYERFACLEAATGPEGLDAAAQSQVDLVLLDVKMPGMDGLEVLSALKSRFPGLPAVMISGHGNVETAVEATRRGAFDFLEKPLDRDRLLLTVRNALGQANLAEENQTLRSSLAERYRLLGESECMVQLRKTIERVAASDARVLITGENGTGKELVARNLHLLSARSRGPWVDVNCAAIPGELIESELFGHEKGAFTGAGQRKTGRFEQAHRGTLFLDEVGDMPLAAQAKMLRVLEENTVQRVGGSESIPVDVRVVAATNKDLEAEVEAQTFREDLFYRLNVIPLRVPSLRERGSDAVELFAHFLQGACKRYDRPPMRLDASAVSWLLAEPWPGNVRQLRNLSERVALLVASDTVTGESFRGLGGRHRMAIGGEAGLFAIDNFELFKETAERLYIEHKLAENGWNVKKTAEALGMQRSNIYKKIERYGLKGPGAP